MQNAFILNEVEYDIGLSRARQGYRLHLNLGEGRIEIPVSLIQGEEGDWVLNVNGEVDHISLAIDGDDVYIHLDGEVYHLRFEHALQRLAQLAEGAGADSVKATMPGSLVSVAVAEGDHVKTGQTLLVMESMKMETTIVSPRDGVVQSIQFTAGQTFDKDAVLVTLEPEAGEE